MSISASRAVVAGAVVATLALAGGGATALAASPTAPTTTGKVTRCTGRVGEANPIFSTSADSVAAATAAKPAASALTCARAKAVLLAGFAAVEKKGLYTPGLKVSVAGVSYELEVGRVPVPGSVAWVGAGTVVSFVHPSGQ